MTDELSVYLDELELKITAIFCTEGLTKTQQVDRLGPLMVEYTKHMRDWGFDFDDTCNLWNNMVADIFVGLATKH